MHKKIFFIFTLILCSCSKIAPVQKEGKPLILVSIPPYQNLAQEIAGPNYTILSIVPEKTNPHSFEPTPSDVSALTRANIFFTIGEPFEKKIVPALLQKNQDLAVIDLQKGIPLIGEGCCAKDTVDRHFWLSPKIALLQAASIKDALLKTFPEDRETFETNFQALSSKLSALDQTIAMRLAPLKNKTLLVSHPAFAYFCREYDLKQLSLEQEGKELRPQQLEEVLLSLSKEPAQLTIALPQHSKRGARLIAQKKKIPLKTIDPYLANYFETMENLTRSIENPHD